jgi:hypothetical protein
MSVAAVLALLVSLDAITTYILSLLYPYNLEFNPILRALLSVDRRLVFAYAPVEFLALYAIYRLYSWFLRKIGFGKRLEYIFVFLPLLAVASNVAGIIAAFL